MARGQRKAVEDKSAEKEELIGALKARLKSEQSELELLYREKRDRDLEGLNQMIESSGLDLNEAAEILKAYMQKNAEQQSA